MDKTTTCKACGTPIKLGRKVCSPACMRAHLSKLQTARRAAAAKKTRVKPKEQRGWRQREEKKMVDSKPIQDFLCGYKP